jgi:hypothetical protein
VSSINVNLRARKSEILTRVPGLGGALAIHIRHQNAGVFVMKVGDLYFFEVMELLARDGDVMGCKGRFKRQFPDRSIAVKASHVQEPMFRSAFVDVLVKLDREPDSGERTNAKRPYYN